MNFLDKMERKFGRYAISNLSIYIIITYAAGYLLTALAPNVVSYLVLEPALILRGQIWRLVTWLLIPPGSLDLFTIITLMFYYSIGSSLERTWGAFRYNVYIFSGILMSIVGSFILYFIFGGGTTLLLYTGTVFSTYYISMSIFLAFAATYPDMQVLFMMIIPLKVKWLGIAYVVLMLWDMITAGWGLSLIHI